MNLRYRKSIKIGGVRLNLSGSGIGMSVGMKGLRTGIDSKGRKYVAGGIPGTGVHFRDYVYNRGNRTPPILLNPKIPQHQAQTPPFSNKIDAKSTLTIGGLLILLVVVFGGWWSLLALVPLTCWWIYQNFPAHHRTSHNRRQPDLLARKKKPDGATALRLFRSPCQEAFLENEILRSFFSACDHQMASKVAILATSGRLPSNLLVTQIPGELIHETFLGREVISSDQTLIGHMVRQKMYPEALSLLRAGADPNVTERFEVKADHEPNTEYCYSILHHLLYLKANAEEIESFLAFGLDLSAPATIGGRKKLPVELFISSCSWNIDVFLLLNSAVPLSTIDPKKTDLLTSLIVANAPDEFIHAAIDFGLRWSSIKESIEYIQLLYPERQELIASLKRWQNTGSPQNSVVFSANDRISFSSSLGGAHGNPNSDR